MIQINNKMLREMKKLYIEVYGTEKIAKKFNLAITTTRNYLLKSRVKFRKASKDKVSISQHNKFINLYEQGKSMKKIAQICKVELSKNGLSYPKTAKKLNISTSAAWNNSKHIGSCGVRNV